MTVDTVIASQARQSIAHEATTGSPRRKLLAMTVDTVIASEAWQSIAH